MLDFLKKKKRPSKEEGAITVQTESAESSFTIVDMLAPQYVEVDFNHIRINDHFYRIYMVIGYPHSVLPTWLSPLINFDSSITISIFYYPVDSDQILDKLRRKIAELEASLSTEYQAGKVLDPKTKVALSDARTLLDNVAAGSEKFFNTSMYIRIQAETVKELDLIGKNLSSMLAAIGLTVAPTTLRMEEGFNSTLPLVSDKMYRIRNMDTTSLAMTFPFVTSELTMDTGILYGINLHNNSLVIFDRFSMHNPNEVVFATSGAGKSYYVKLEALRYLMTGVQIIIIDPEKEYDKLTEAVDGDYITFSQDESAKINPFEFLKEDSSGLGKRNVLRDKILSLHTFFKLLFGEISTNHSAVLDRALILTYREKGISNDPATWKNRPPLLEDLYKILKGMIEPEARDMSNRLERYVMGSAAGVFNQPTNVDINNNFTTFSLQGLRDELRPIAMYMILDFIWTRIQEKRAKRLLIVDEAWTMMQYEDSAKFIYGIAKRCRKYWMGLTTISQDVDEFLNSKYGKAIVTNASIKALFKQSSAAIDLIQGTFNLSGGERVFLLNAGVGQGIFFADRNHVAMQVIASRGEHRLITSNPQELHKMVQNFQVYTESEIEEAALVYDGS